MPAYVFALLLVIVYLIAHLYWLSKKRMLSAESEAFLRKERRLLERTAFMTHHDMLSGLPNRHYFEKKLTQELRRLEEPDQASRMLAVMFIDLDRFKYINDIYGHTTGDEIIRLVGRRLKESSDSRITVARLGGDEFAVLFTDIDGRDEPFEWSQAMLDVMGTPLQLAPLELRLTGSIGITVAPEDGTTTMDLMRNADIALYKAKALGRNKCCFHTKELNRAFKKNLAIEQALRKALEQEEFVLHYQPQYGAGNKQLVGAEALIRWQPRVGPLVSPADFIPLAEETGLIVPIGEWVLRTACSQAADWLQRGLPPFRISVNVSPRQLDESDYAENVLAILGETGLPPQYLMLEITEGVAIREEKETLAKLLPLKQQGVQFAIDDFGTGYSSLSYLMGVQADALKIAQMFINYVPGCPGQAAIVKAIVAMAGSLKLTVIAEGVETEEQFEFLRSQGCHWIQGYYFMKPVTAMEFERLHPISDREEGAV
ncbi:putative bifunctional diguanylate cyclase/phosphodiesterase [Paenibacillus spongiae]|uniref:EAL domain-containing protein n=1 Tax=Paenibacillus spongiae TaxID=2909671 RepID=A0ABY5S839_9BACL|nr:EAL domain-containing protein [Paenibacillus spongiae]UVI30077.1 EAL domain-containing protein [Paenibacillus spongiae]